MKTLVVQKWEESERGWGTRPDGYSLHLTEEDRKEYIKYYWSQMPKEIPEEYSRLSGTPYCADVDDNIVDEVESSKNGVRYYNNTYPGDGGVDGWMPYKRDKKD